MLAFFEFALEYQKGTDNRAADALSWVPICQNCETVQSLMESAIVGATDQGEAEASEELFCKHVHLKNEVQAQAVKLAPMHMVDWREVQEADAVLAACRKWLHICRDTPPQKRNI